MRAQEKIGILGGGQLGCMLADAALAMGLSPLFYAEPASPAEALFTDRIRLGTVANTDALKSFLGEVRVVAFENEFVDCDALEHAAQGLNVRFAPGLDAIRELQDKLRQKELLTRLNLPTAEFTAIRPDASAHDLAAWIQDAYSRFNGEVVFKWSRLGYDGKGVCLAQDTLEGRKRALEFCAASLARRISVYAERKIAFRRELAIVVSRSNRTPSAEFIAYPLVVSEQERGICKRVLGPATALGVSPQLETQAQEAARLVGNALKLEGTYALELFETAQGQLLINEIAPRVHNTGHYSQDACQVSQFENHWRAILDRPLPPMPTGAFGMLNLLGPDGVTLSVIRKREGIPFSPPAQPVRFHWYAKSDVRPGRKVGHLNAAASAPHQLLALTEALDRSHAEWIRELKQLQSKRNPASP